MTFIVIVTDDGSFVKLGGDTGDTVVSEWRAATWFFGLESARACLMNGDTLLSITIPAE